MRRRMMVVSGVVAALAVCSVLFAMNREEIANRPLRERMQLEEEMRASENVPLVHKLSVAETVPQETRLGVSKAPPRPVERTMVVRGTRDAGEKGVILAEGFEGTWPPTGWDSPDTWVRGDVRPHTGIYDARCPWGHDLDEWLTTPSLDFSGLTVLDITFWWKSSYYWHVDPNDHGDLFVQVSTDGGTSWDTLWTFGDSAMVVNSGGVWPWTNWVWYEATLDLSPYAGQPDVRIAFRVVANDNADSHIDDVVVSYPLDHDVGVTAIHAPVGTYLPDVSVTPSVEVENFGANVDTFDVTFKIFDAGMAEVYSETQSAVVDVGMGAVVDFPVYTTVIGEYTTLAYTELATDLEPLNDSLPGTFSVPEPIPGDTIYYDDGIEVNAFAWLAEGNGFGLKFTPASYPMTINGVLVHLWEDTWPDPGANYYEIRLVDDDGVYGSPGTTIYQSPVLTGVRGDWNTIDLRHAGIEITSGDFYLFYIQVGDHPNCPGLSIDTAVDAPAGHSWDYFEGAYRLDNDVPGDWLLRCIVEYGTPRNRDVGVSEIIVPAGQIPAEEILTPQLEVRNFGTQDATFDVTIEWTGYSETQNVTVLAGERDTVAFTPFTTVVGTYDVTAYTTLVGDEYPLNDSLSRAFSVRYIIFFEDFEAGIPAEWNIVDGFGDGIGWTTFNPGGRTPAGGCSGLFPICDSDFYDANVFYEELITPPIDCSRYKDILLSFSNSYRNFAGWDWAYVAVSNDGGLTWTDVIAWNDDVEDSPVVDLDISAIADGRSDVRIRFLYDTDGHTGCWWWMIDNVELSALDTIAHMDYDVRVEGLPNEGDPGLANDTLVVGVFDPYIIVKNNSTYAGPALSFVVHYKLANEDGDIIGSKAANVHNLAPQSQDTVHFQGGIPLMYVGTYTATVTIRTGFADPIMGNNVSTRQFELVPGDGAKMGTEVPMVFALYGAQPNPVWGDAAISYQLPNKVDVSLKVYDVSGRMVTTLVAGVESAGYYNVRWTPPSAGIYFVKLTAGDYRAVRRIVALK